MQLKICFDFKWLFSHCYAYNYLLSNDAIDAPKCKGERESVMKIFVPTLAQCCFLIALNLVHQ